MSLERIRALNSFAYSNMERKDVRAIGVKYSGLVVGCTYKGKDCSESDFISFLHPSLINCFTFRLNRSLESKNSNLLVGPNNGLSLVLRSEANNNFLYENLDKLQNVDSVRLAVHAPFTVPFMTNKGINLRPGESTSVSLMMQTYDRLGSPYTECENRGPFELDTKRYISTSDVCQVKCIIQKIQKECNCTSTLFEDLTTSKYNFCSQIIDNLTLMQSHERTLCEIDYAQGTKDLDCNECVWDCREINYDTQIASSSWPHETKIRHFIQYHVLNHFRNYYPYPRQCTDPIKSYYAVLLRKANLSKDMCPETDNNVTDNRLEFSLMRLSNNIHDSRELFAFTRPDFTTTFKYVMDVPNSYYIIKTVDELNAKWMRDSFYRVNIYFRQSTVEQHSQVASFTFADLCSNIGGTLGLWLGCSVMTIIEIWSYVIKSLYRCCFKERKIDARKIAVSPHGTCSDKTTSSG